MLSKSLIQFSVDGQGYVPSLLFDLRPNYGGGNEDNDDLQRSHPCPATLSASDPAAGHHQPTLPPEILGHSWACLGQFFVGSLLFSPAFWCTQGFVCALQESVSPVLCKFWGLYGGFNGDLLPEGILPYPGVLHPEPLPLHESTTDPLSPLQETLRHSSGSFSVGSLGPGAHKVLFVPSKSLFIQSCVSSGGSMVG